MPLLVSIIIEGLKDADNTDSMFPDVKAFVNVQKVL